MAVSKLSQINGGTAVVYNPATDDLVGVRSGATDELIDISAVGTDASALTSGTVAAARGGAGSVSGLMKADGAGAVSAAAAGTDYVAPGGALGTPSGGNLANCTFPTLNQNTTGTASNITATSNSTLTDLSALTQVGLSTAGFVTTDAGGNLTGGAVSTGFALNTDTITADGTYSLVTYMPFAGTLTDIKQISCNSGGSVTLDFKLNGTGITGLTAVAVTSTAGDAAASGGNTFSKGDKLTVTASSTTGVTAINGTILCTRTA